MFRFCVENSIEEKVIEKAYKKLRLDALVIQQGRLTENTKSVNKDDLLAMVRYGAEMVFSSEVRAPRPRSPSRRSCLSTLVLALILQAMTASDALLRAR